MRQEKSTSFTLPVQQSSRTLTRALLLLGIAALIGSGLFSILLVASRTPAVQDMIPWLDFFHTALVVHVDLSVVIWFLCMSGVLWSLDMTRARPRIAFAAWLMMATGTAIIAASPFLGIGDPVMNNYVPVLQHPLYYTGLIALGAGFGLLALHAFLQPMDYFSPESRFEISFALRVSALVSMLALTSIISASTQLVPGIDSSSYFELLFWGGGHTIQFAYTILLMVAWLFLASAGGMRPWLPEWLGLALFSLMLMPGLATPLLDMVYPVTSVK